MAVLTSCLSSSLHILRCCATLQQLESSAFDPLYKLADSGLNKSGGIPIQSLWQSALGIELYNRPLVCHRAKTSVMLERRISWRVCVLPNYSVLAAAAAAAAAATAAATA